MMIRARAAAFVVAAIPATAFAQIPTMPIPLCTKAVPSQPVAAIGELTTKYNQGDWAGLQKKAREVVDAAKTPASGCTDAPALLNYKTNYVAVTWIGTDPLTAKAQYMRLIVHDPAPSPFVNDLPGIAVDSGDPQLGEIFLARSADASAITVYTSTREENPIAGELPGFVQAVAGGLFGAIAGVAPPPGARIRREKPPTPQLFATISRVHLPMKRASIHLQAAVNEAADPDDFTKALAELPPALRLKESAYSRCARLYANNLASELTAGASGPSCAGDGFGSKECKASLLDAMERAFADAINGELGDCKPDKDDVGAIQDVDRKFRSLVATGTASSADADLTFHNRPLTRWALGAGSAVITGAKLSLPRVKLGDDKNIDADPLGRLMTTAFVNWSPAGYDETAPSIRPKERWRLFFGAALTPDFGVVGGLNFLIVRGVGIAGGIGMLFSKGANPDEIGHPPASATDPFKLSYAGVAFIGITYNYK